jgi:hypothetical protein
MQDRETVQQKITDLPFYSHDFFRFSKTKKNCFHWVETENLGDFRFFLDNNINKHFNFFLDRKTSLL